MKILISGASSYIGTYLCKHLNSEIHKGADIEVVGLYNSNSVSFPNIKLQKLNITDFDGFTKLFSEFKPDVVIHLASVTQTQSSKHSESYIELVNHRCTNMIAELCKDLDSFLIYTSTDLVYAEGSNITEKSELNPLTPYANTKLSGEISIRDISPRHIILRTSLVYGHTISAYKTFFDNAYKSLCEGENYFAFDDQYRCPIFVEDVTENLLNLLNYKSENVTANFCGDECLTRLEMCNEIADIFGFDKSLIIPVSCNSFKEHPMVKKLDLRNDIMKELGLISSSYRSNLLKIKMRDAKKN